MIAKTLYLLILGFLLFLLNIYVITSNPLTKIIISIEQPNYNKKYWVGEKYKISIIVSSP